MSQYKGNKNSNWKGGKVIDRGYVYIHKPDHPKASKRPYIAEHVLVMEKHLGRYLTNNEVIHHKDGNKQNNELKNLKLMLRKEHASLHGRKAKTIEIICSFCKKKVVKRYSNIAFKLKQGQKDFYCNRSCMAKHFGKNRPKK